MALEKHRDEKEAFKVDFSARLGSGETLTGTPEVKVFKTRDNAEVSSEFGIANILIVGDTDVQFTLSEASGTDQDKGPYYVYVKADTSDSEILVEIFDLNITIR